MNENMNEIDLTAEEIDHILKEMIIPQIIGDISPQANKEAFILGGQPGSGKSTLVREILKPNKNTVFINGDDLRPYHPKYYFFLKNDDREAADLTQRICNLWVEKLIEECTRQGLNMIVEGTMRTKEAPLSTAQKLKDADYLLNLVAISAPSKLSLLSLEYRYNELKRLGGMARYTKRSSHDEAYEKIEDTIGVLSATQLFDRYDIYLRTAQGFEKRTFGPEEAKQMMEIFIAGRQRKLEDQEEKIIHLNQEFENHNFPVK